MRGFKFKEDAVIESIEDVKLVGDYHSETMMHFSLSIKT
jgi:hypothetical protein